MCKEIKGITSKHIKKEKIYEKRKLQVLPPKKKRAEKKKKHKKGRTNRNQKNSHRNNSKYIFKTLNKQK